MLEEHINIICDEEADFDRARRDLPALLAYCKKFGTTEVNVFADSDLVKGHLIKENYYYFGDSLGSYTLVGVVASLA